MFLSPCLVTNPAVCARLSVFTWSCVRVLLEGGWSEPACLWAQGKSPSPRPCMGNGTDWGKECSPRGAEEKETLIGPAPCPKAMEKCPAPLLVCHFPKRLAFGATACFSCSSFAQRGFSSVLLLHHSPKSSPFPKAGILIDLTPHKL